MFKPSIFDTSTDWTEAVFGKSPFLNRVLVVADGGINFNSNLIGFSLTLFCASLLETALPWEKIQITTAHRGPSTDITGAQLKEFKFDSVVNGVPSFSINQYEQLWLFGFDGEHPKLALEESEIDAITTFMSNGGGVFATGDHQDVGAALCGRIPRVRLMRRWYFSNTPPNLRPAPDLWGATRLDSLRAGKTPGFEHGDEKDEVPQEIRPRYSTKADSALPHPLLAFGEHAITMLPDHRHEGECVSPHEIKERLAENDNYRKDFPVSCDSEHSEKQVLPEVVAISTSAGGIYLPRVGAFPVEPRCYVVISAYDGHEVRLRDVVGNISQLGRVVVDASFHHFVNLNLHAFLKTGDSNEYFRLFSQYYRNILKYLLPPPKQLTFFLNLLLALRFTPPLLEEIRNLSFGKGEDILYAGRATKEVLESNFSRAEARRCVLTLLSIAPESSRLKLNSILDVWTPSTGNQPSLLFVNTETIAEVILGSAMLALATELPTTHYQVSQALFELKDKGKSLQSMVEDGLNRGVQYLQGEALVLAQEFTQFSELVCLME